MGLFCVRLSVDFALLNDSISCISLRSNELRPDREGAESAERVALNGVSERTVGHGPSRVRRYRLESTFSR
jgi:hypothetical protein